MDRYDSMKKRDLQDLAISRHISSEGTVPQLKARLRRADADVAEIQAAEVEEDEESAEEDDEDQEDEYEDEDAEEGQQEEDDSLQGLANVAFGTFAWEMRVKTPALLGDDNWHAANHAAAIKAAEMAGWPAARKGITSDYDEETGTLTYYVPRSSL